MDIQKNSYRITILDEKRVCIFLLNPLLYDFYLFINPDFNGKNCSIFQTLFGEFSFVMILL